MAKKNISTGLETALVANEPFEYAHLVKFETVCACIWRASYWY